MKSVVSTWLTSRLSSWLSPWTSLRRQTAPTITTVTTATTTTSTTRASSESWFNRGASSAMTTDRKTIDRSNFSGFEELLRMLLGSVLQYFLRTILAFLADLADNELTFFLTNSINYHKFGNRLRSTQCYLHSLWLPRLQARQPQSPKSAQINSEKVIKVCSWKALLRLNNNANDWNFSLWS